MTTEKRNKLKVTLANHIQGTVALSSWLERLGISHDLQKYYRKSGWLEAIGTGALKRPGEEVTWQGALYSMQVQAKVREALSRVGSILINTLLTFPRSWHNDDNVSGKADIIFLKQLFVVGLQQDSYIFETNIGLL
ncbi:MAG: AbiEi antitoxin N-terminal domain-containing protein [Chlorobiales bacterium]|nr:AbiEi antitoxin N-terminal domain-containing protein [Chlorobiales bacterium]